MSSPFTFFRRNQQVTMVSIVILSMVAFTISDMMTQQTNHFVTLGALLGGIVLAFAGISRGRWIQYGLGGALCGGLLGWILPGFVASPDGFYQSSTLGGFDDERIRNLYTQRSIANSFMAQAFGKVYGAGTEQFAPQFRYYPTVQDDAIFGELLRAEAKELQIVVTDKMVSDYINQATDGRLSAKMFAEIRTGLNLGGLPVSEDQLFDAFREEIAARMAYTQLAPGMSVSAQDPALYYDLFRRSQVKQRMNTIRLDVDAFLGEVAEPTDAEIQAAFAQHSKKFPGMDGPGSMGFRQFNKAALAYLELDYKSVESTVAQPTDAEVEAFYNEKKDTFYRKPAAPAEPPAEAPAETPATPTGETAPEATPAAPAEAGAEVKPDDTPAAPDAPAAPAETPAPTETPAPATPDPAAPQSAPEAPATEPGAGNDCLPFSDEPAAPATAAETPAPATETPAPATDAAQQPAPAATEPAAADAAATPPAATETPAAAEAAPAAEPAAATPAGEEPLTIPAAPAQDAAPFVIPPVEYLPLDDELRTEIRDQLFEQKVRAAVDEKMDAVMKDLAALEKQRSAARRAIVDRNQNISSEELASQMKDTAKSLLEGMKAAGTKHGLAFVETGLLSASDLSSDDKVPVGSALDSNTGTTVVDQVFSAFPQRDPYEDVELYVRHRAVRNMGSLDGAESHFAWWITEFSPTHVPALDDPGIREEVILTLKRQKAGELAKKRADELAAVIRDGLSKPEAEQKPVSELVAGQTVTGKPDGAAAVVRQTQLFSWLEQDVAARMNFNNQRPSIRLSTINFADEAGGFMRSVGDRFMKSVFEDLQAGETGVVADDQLRSYYVVQISERVANEEVLRQLFLQEGRQFGFQSGDVAQLTNAIVGQPAMTDWTDTLWKKYGIDRNSLPD